MLRLVFWRALQVIPMLVLVSLVVFGLMEFSPIDPARAALSAGGTNVLLDERDVIAKRIELGLDRPFWERYARWWSDALSLNLGYSYTTRQPVATIIAQRLPASAILAALTLLVSVLVALPLGMFAAVRAGSWADHLARLLTLLGASLPNFWLALLAIWLFAAQLHWVPALGSLTPQGIILPIVVLSLRTIGLLMRLMRATTLDALSLEYVNVARAKGLSEPLTLARHVFPNALMPVLTVIGLDFAALLANAAIVEWLFAFPGIGQLGVNAALASDLPVIMAFVLVVSLVVVVVNLIVDIGYGLIDPRQRATEIA